MLSLLVPDTVTDCGAAEGAGLGLRFLKHLERTRLLLHIVDLAPFDPEVDPVREALAIVAELKKYDAALHAKPRWLVLNKIDLVEGAERSRRCADIVRRLRAEGRAAHAGLAPDKGISATLVGALVLDQLQIVLHGQTRLEHAMEEPAAFDDHRQGDDQHRLPVRQQHLGIDQQPDGHKEDGAEHVADGFDEFLDAMELAHQMPVDVAFRKSIGLTPMELGQRILAESSLPKLIQHTLEPARSDMIHSKKLTDTEKLLVVADFSEKFCELIEQPELTNVTYEAGVDHLLKSYAPSLELDEDELKEAIAKVSHSMNTVGQAQGFKSFASLIVNRMERIAAGSPIEKQPTHPAATGVESTSPTPDAPDRLAMAIGEIERLVTSRPVDTRKIYTAAVRAVRAGLHARSSLVFLRDHDTPLFSPIIGVGPMFHEVRNQPLIDPDHKDVFSVCIARGEDVLIKNPDEPSIAPFIPAWFRSSVSKGPLLLLPVKDVDGTFAVICVVAGMADRIDLSAPRLQQLKRLRACLAMLRDAGFDRRTAA